ncbi:MAG: family 43 glycosylhydrolase [Bacteroidaceae bacterium]|nr:family 43 glycosylhydrolase [Bacteroidaceae bacterium]
MKRTLFLLILIFVAQGLPAQNRANRQSHERKAESVEVLPTREDGLTKFNPVIPGIADAGVIRYAGKYYLGGVATFGDFFVSSDLLHWDERIHVFDLDNEWTHGTGARNNQVHADDITFSNGLFHLLFSVNYWGDDRHIVHITHAVSPSVTGPYKEVREDQWFENRIDPMVFRDDDGRLYLYMVKFTDGNTIWAREMNQDFSFAGDAIQQFSSQPGTWETLDNRVAEGPFVIKYRGRYYMMYNANHTSPRYGHYRLGVCEATSPLSFNPGGKYSGPVLGSNMGWPDDEPETKPEDKLETPGQPSIVRGPNGWEWWLVYMANLNGRRSQFVDRVHFTRNRLAVDGITGPHTPGYHPVPALPKLQGNSLDGISLDDAFLLELTFHSSASHPGIRLGEKTLTLPNNMNSKASHVWRIEKNHQLLSLWIDDILVYDHIEVEIPSGSSVTWAGNAADYTPEYISYCEGWDESDSFFSGWEGLAADEQGLRLPATEILKGKPAKDCEFSVLFDNATPDRGSYGIVLKSDNPKEYIQASIDAARQMLVIDNCIKGKVKRSEYPLQVSRPHFPDVKYTDTYEQQYRFDADTYVSAISLPRSGATADPYAADLDIKSDATSETGDVVSLLQFSWLDGDTWRPLEYEEIPSGREGWQTIQFAPVLTRGLRMLNRNPKQNHRSVYRIRTVQDFAAATQLRIDRSGNDIHVYVDDDELATVTHPRLGEAQVGLWSDGEADLHVSNTLFYPVY